MTLLDGFIVVVLAGGLLHGVSAGALRQLASLIGLVFALLVSVQLMHTVGALAVQSLGLSESIAPIVGFVVLFCGVWLIFFAISRLLEQVLEALSLTILNRVAGGGLGALKAALLLSVLFLVLAEIEIPDQEMQQESLLYGPIAGALPKTLDVAAEYVPSAKRAAESFGEKVRPSVESRLEGPE
jgi:membrane protein required for colicin V production